MLTNIHDFIALLPRVNYLGRHIFSVYLYLTEDHRDTSGAKAHWYFGLFRAHYITFSEVVLFYLGSPAVSRLCKKGSRVLSIGRWWK